MFQKIWDKQYQLMKQFDEIEHSHGLLQVPPGYELNLNCKYTQARLKDFAWRITEELTEATIAIKEDNMKAFREEMADVYHFIIELFIIAKMPMAFIFPQDLFSLQDIYQVAHDELDRLVESELGETNNDFSGADEGYDPSLVSFCAYIVIEFLGSAMNELKMRPWKANHEGRNTDEKQFYSCLAVMHKEFLKMCAAGGITVEDLYHSYFSKSEINDARISAGH